MLSLLFLIKSFKFRGVVSEVMRKLLRINKVLMARQSISSINNIQMKELGYNQKE